MPDTLCADIRFGWCQLTKRRATSAASILSLALRPVRLAIVVGLSVASVPGQTRLRVVPDATLASHWKVISSTMDEGPLVANGTVTVQNVSSTAIQEARIYAEYLDAAGRRCFTLAYTSDAAGGGANDSGTPVAPGEIRRLTSQATSVNPISAPVEVHLHLVSQRPVGSPREIVSGDNLVHAPMTGFLPALNPAGASNSVRLELDPSLRSIPLADLALAEVSVSKAGKANAVTILDSVNDNVKSWFENLLRQADFFPESTGFVNSAGNGFVLLRVINSTQGSAPVTLTARQSPWIKELASSSIGDTLPTVMVWALSPTQQAIRSRNGVSLPQVSDSDLFDFVAGGSYWSDASFEPKYTTVNGAKVLLRTWRSSQELIQNVR